MRIKKTFQGNLPENTVVNTQSNSQTNAYSCDYVNRFGKRLWAGSFSSGTITVPELENYICIGVVADGVLMFGNKNFGGGGYGVYGSTSSAIITYRLDNNGNQLIINSNNKGAYNQGSQKAITEIYGIF